MPILIVKKKIILSRNYLPQQADMTVPSHFSAKVQVKIRTDAQYDPVPYRQHPDSIRNLFLVSGIREGFPINCGTVFIGNTAETQDWTATDILSRNHGIKRFAGHLRKQSPRLRPSQLPAMVCDCS